MKAVIFTIWFVVGTIYLYGQDQKIEDDIRQLDQMEVKAVLEKDTAALLKLWDKDFVVNAPDNKVNFAGKTTLDRPVLTRNRQVFTRDVEHVIVRGNTAFSMGSETVSPDGDQENTGKIIKRRYTNIWMNTGGQWKLMARHANVICN